jgi:pimeloyl-ACP methyl ester carboxylesterase
MGEDGMHFVLVPGAMHGAWTWDRVKPLLEAGGHRVIAEDLPGMASLAGQPPAEQVTLALWADAVADQVRVAYAQENGPVILVGHSRGGLVIGEVAERVPDLLAGLIYVTALLVPPGMTGREASGVSPAAAGNGSNRGRAPVAAVASIDPAIARPLLYHRCTEADAAWAIERLCAEPMTPLGTAATVTPERWGLVPRAFVACSDDRLLTPERQNMMLATVPCDPVVTLDSDHSPFLSAPDALAAVMIEIADDFVAGGRRCAT